MDFYGFLLRLYPASFRNEYGSEMRAVFERRRRQTSSAGALALWLGTIGETVVNAAAVHTDILRQDLSYAARMLRRSPGFAITAIAIVALGIGATTAAFSVTDFVLLRPLPFPEPDRLVTVLERTPGDDQMELSAPHYRDWKAAATAVESVGVYHAAELGGGEGGGVVGGVGGLLPPDGAGVVGGGGAPPVERRLGQRGPVLDARRRTAPRTRVHGGGRS